MNRPFTWKKSFVPFPYMYPDGTFLGCRQEGETGRLLHPIRKRQTSPLADIQAGWRPIGKQRARTLRRRGEAVEWRPELHSMAWLPGGR